MLVHCFWQLLWNDLSVSDGDYMIWKELPALEEDDNTFAMECIRWYVVSSVHRLSLFSAPLFLEGPPHGLAVCVCRKNLADRGEIECGTVCNVRNLLRDVTFPPNKLADCIIMIHVLEPVCVKLYFLDCSVSYWVSALWMFQSFVMCLNYVLYSSTWMHCILCVEIGEMEACPPCCNALVAVIIPGMLLAFWWCERGRCKHQLSLTFWFITHGLRRTQYMFMWAYYCLYWSLHYKLFLIYFISYT